MTLGQVFALFQSVTLLIPASSIWGKHLNRLDTASIERGMKVGLLKMTRRSTSINLAAQAQYAGWLFFVPTLCFAKFSVLAGLLQLTPFATHRRCIKMIGAVVGAWLFTSIFLLAFQCGAPDSWDFRHRGCLSRVRNGLRLEYCHPLIRLSRISEIAVLVRERPQHSD